MKGGFMTELELIKEAFQAQSFSYAPYSNFHVGAALLGKSGKVFHGCNIENAALTPTNCAERTAFFKAISEGETEFEVIAVVGSLEGTKKEEAEYCAPCGVCRQVMAEFCNPKEFRVIIARTEEDYKEYLLEDLLPLSFTRKDINK
jgi:cytidine deaminase